VLQCVVLCSICVVACCSVPTGVERECYPSSRSHRFLQCVAMCDSVLQCTEWGRERAAQGHARHYTGKGYLCGAVFVLKRLQ